jgi:hypothetical protein
MAGYGEYDNHMPMHMIKTVVMFSRTHVTQGDEPDRFRPPAPEARRVT